MGCEFRPLSKLSFMKSIPTTSPLTTFQHVENILNETANDEHKGVWNPDSCQLINVEFVEPLALGSWVKVTSFPNYFGHVKFHVDPAHKIKADPNLFCLKSRGVSVEHLDLLQNG